MPEVRSRDLEAWRKPFFLALEPSVLAAPLMQYNPGLFVGALWRHLTTFLWFLSSCSRHDQNLRVALLPWAGFLIGVASLAPKLKRRES